MPALAGMSFGSSDAQREQARRAGDRDRAVDVAGHGGGGAVEVDHQVVAVDRHAYADRDVLVRDAVALDLALGRGAAVRQRTDRLARAPLGVVDHLAKTASTTSRPRRSISSPSRVSASGSRRSGRAGRRGGCPACGRWPGSARARRSTYSPSLTSRSGGMISPSWKIEREPRRHRARAACRRRPSDARG